MRRLFWEEQLTLFESTQPARQPHFACSCSRERVARMIQSLGKEEADSIVAERGQIEVACEFCGVQYPFDAIDTAHLFVPPTRSASAGPAPH